LNHAGHQSSEHFGSDEKSPTCCVDIVPSRHLKNGGAKRIFNFSSRQKLRPLFVPTEQFVISGLHQHFMNLGALVIHHNDFARGFGTNVDRDLPRNIDGDFLGLIYGFAIQTYRVLDPIAVNDLEMKFGH
jgi:hypothetical protein